MRLGLTFSFAALSVQRMSAVRIWASLGALIALGCAASAPRGYKISGSDGCEVTIFERVPDYAREDLRRVRVQCEGQALCVQALRAHACAIGGDTVYALEPRLSPARFGPAERRPQLRAIIARRVNLEQAVGWSARDFVRSDAPSECRPSCKSGYRCEAGQCRARCACDQGSRCDADRICRGP